MPVDAEPLDDQPVEMADQIVGQIEGGGVFLRHRVEDLVAGIEGVTVRAGDAFDAFLGQHFVEFAAGAAIAVEHQNAVIAPARITDPPAHALRDLIGGVVPGRRQAADRQVTPGVDADQRHDFARQRAAGDEQRALLQVEFGLGGGHGSGLR